jgi:predicted regulator of Ras-like GTPase activity (Roadblock/LC7/MglB family)
MTAASDGTPTSRAGEVRRILGALVRRKGAHGGLIVAPDGFLIAADLADGIEVEALAALTATLGRELELGAGRLERGAFATALISAAEGGILLGASPVGFLAVLVEPGADVGLIRAEMKRALDAVLVVWEGRATAGGVAAR